MPSWHLLRGGISTPVIAMMPVTLEFVTRPVRARGIRLADLNSAGVYLASLTSPDSRLTMRQALDLVSDLPTDALALGQTRFRPGFRRRPGQPSAATQHSLCGNSSMPWMFTTQPEP